MSACEQKGFSLVELLIVLAMILVVAAVAIPNVLRTRVTANESSAIGSVRDLMAAETAYAARYPDIGFTCDIRALGPALGKPSQKAAGLVDAATASGAKSGYNFWLSGCTGTPRVAYQVHADPQRGEGVRKFCADQSGKIHYDPGAGACSVNASPLLQ